MIYVFRGDRGPTNQKTWNFGAFSQKYSTLDLSKEAELVENETLFRL